jgi:hypothetical protein
MLKSNTFKMCLLIPVIIFCLNLSGFSSDQCIPPDCPPNISTIPEIVEYPPDWLLECDSENNPIEFQSGEPPVGISVTGGVAPYKWEVNTGFSLACYDDCGASNTLSSQGTDCIASVTVTDSTGRTTLPPCKVRRPGYWEATFCYFEKRWGCYSNPCNSIEPTILDLGDHWVKFWCCEQSGKLAWTGTCDDGWSYTAKEGDCIKPGDCEDSGINGLQIKKWICN